MSEIGYGAWGIGGNQWRGGADDDSLAALRRAMELGLNFIDTALAYNEGHSERLIAQVIADVPLPVTVATKIPPKNRIWPAQPGIALDDVFPYGYLIECTETSLRNLNVETIDLQQLHVWNPEFLHRDEWRRGIEDLKASGKVRHFGISIDDHQPDSALSLIETGLIDTVQVIYNIFDQSPEKHLFPACLKHNIGVLARVPLDEGALTGKMTLDTTFEEGDFRAWYFRDGRMAQVVERVAALQRDLGEMKQSLADVALQFCLGAEAVSTVIPGMRTLRNVESNCCVSQLGPLSSDQWGVLRKHAWNKNFYQ